jgi:diguanylate cyclase (GGDEF)-like protein/PAS domain S-box-containing protein
MATVLVVDDHSINRKFLAALLGYAGHTVVEAADGKEASAIAQRSRPDLIITDLIMPAMGGLELTRRLRTDPATADIPVVFYTAAHSAIEAREMARSCGVDLVLPKPSEPQVILDAVAEILGMRAAKAGMADKREGRFAPAGPEQLRELACPQPSPHKRPKGNGDASGESAEPTRRIDTRSQPPAEFLALCMRLAALLELGLTLGAVRDPQCLLDLFCRAAQDILGTRYAGVVLSNSDRDTVLQWSASGVADTARADLGSINLVGSMMGKVLRGKEPIRLLSGDAARGELPASHPPIEALLVAPMSSPSGRIRGVLYFADKISGAAFDEHDEQFATTLAAQLALSYGNLRLFGEMQRHAGELQIEVAERKQAEEALRESNEKFNQLADNITDAFWIRSPDMRVVQYVSPAFERIWGRSMKSLYTNPHQWVDFILPEDRARVSDAFAKFAEEAQRLDIEYRIVRPDGEIRWIRVRGFHVRDAAGKIIRLAGIVTDITEGKEQQDKISRLSRTRVVIGGISSAMLRLRDRDELLREACRVAATEGVFPIAWVSAIDPQTQKFEIVAWHSEDPQGVDIITKLNECEAWPMRDRPSCRAAQTARPFVINDISTDPMMAPIRENLLHRDYRACAAFPLFVEGRVVAVLMLLAGERDFFDAEEIALLDWLTADLSYALEHIEKSQRLDYLASYDTLTGLPNVRLFSDRLEQLVHAARQDECPVCVVVADLERFTQINDTLGRSVGDELLRQVGQRFEQVLVEPYALGRIGADTFAVASPRDSEIIATKLRDRMLDALKQPFSIDGRQVSITMQAGIALFPADGDDGKTVFKNAEVALKAAKSSGDRYVYYSSDMQARISRRLALEEELSAAIDNHQLVLHYQAQVDMISGELVGAEALIRWQHPDKGLIAPAEFIALAEETGLIVPIGAWVIQQVCAQQAAWIAAGIAAVPIAVNVSSIQFEMSDLAQTVGDALTAHSLSSRYLELELTESAVMADPEAATRSLQTLHKLGVRLALDDFGTGYSSLAHLKRFPFDAVKIDQSFVVNIISNPEDAAIARAIIAMAHGLGLKVIAEGVETQGQFNYLRAQGCDGMQGLHFSPAIVKEEFEAQLVAGKRMTLPVHAPGEEHTLLLVDDEPGIRSALKRTLRRDGYHILTASNGPEALEMLALNSVQVIISDQRMPDMSGTEFLNIVKQLYPDTLRIILSGYTDLEVVTDSVNRGAVFKFLTKPWDEELLREQVRDAFRRYRPESTRH